MFSALILDVQINSLSLPLINFRKFITGDKKFCAILKEENHGLNLVSTTKYSCKKNFGVQR